MRRIVSYEDRSGITWANSTSSALHPFREGDFSLFAVCRASRALAAAAVFRPGNVEAPPFGEPTKSRSLIASWHGTLLAFTKRENAP
jgi:hypothetical protein